ncbi:glycosyltransferase family 4 protein [Bradyrhizobium sp. STM 3557]|uniref:glycosyltransferase family 4 protein n=1 Tax=Bradyrhizobium sp. STM 3557 TaxID=578920 RepID=UPI00388D5DD7
MSRLSSTRILMTTDTVGGVWSYATALANRLASFGAEVHLVTQGPQPRADQRAMLDPTKIHLIETDLALEWQDPEAADLDRARRALSRLDQEIRPDIIHLNSYREATFEWHAPVVLVAHSCVNSWGQACHDTTFLAEPRWQRYSQLVAAGLGKASVWVAPTCAFGETIANLYRPPRPGVLIWNGFTPAFQSIMPKQPLILAAGRMWDKAKNLAALAAVADAVPCPIEVAGAGAEPGQQNLPIHLLGELPQAELWQRMLGAAIFASPALYEPFGLSVLEAAAAGCALVLADIPTFRELWQDAAIFVAPADENALRSALSWLAADADACTALQRAARRRARRYTVGRMATRYAELYLDLLGQRSTQPLVESCA